MIQGRQWTIRMALSLLATAFLQAEAHTLELQALLEKTTVTPPARVAFLEERHNQLLREPMKLGGHLEYLGPGVLRKVVETPFEETYLIESGRIIIERDGKTRRLSLKKGRALRTLLDAIEAILAGDAEKISSVFSFDIQGTAAAWSVLLTPISPKIGKHISDLEVSASDRAVESIRINLRDGEWHLMTIIHDAEAP